MSGDPSKFESDLFAFLDGSPSPFHVVASASARLVAAGIAVHDFATVQEAVFANESGAIVRDGSLIAWKWPEAPASAGTLIVGAHTDSPTLRLKPKQTTSAAGFGLLDVEIYGGVLLNSWLDRDLGIAGVVRTSSGHTHMVDFQRPVARIPQLAIHLDRDVNEKGLVLNRQAHMRPVWSMDGANFLDALAAQVGTRDVAATNLVLYDTTPARRIGDDESMVASGRLDNQLSCWAAVSALCSGLNERPVVVALFDHEEVGSESITGAAGPMLEMVLRGLVSARIAQTSWFDFVRSALCISADNAHALHPNYTDRHDANHSPVINRGPALKTNANQRYATTVNGASVIRAAASLASVPLQEFVSNNAMPCGSTIGPITATRLGIETVDIGVPQLSMHSARELCGASDPMHLVNLLVAMGRAGAF